MQRHAPQGAMGRLAGRVPKESAGFLFGILLAWLFFEFGRPPQAFKIPMAIGIISFIAWLGRPNKQWGTTGWLFVAFLGVMGISIPFAANNFTAFWGTWDMTLLFMTICLPLMSLVNTTGRVRMWINTYLWISLYVGLWAASHNGFGPAGTDGHDENYMSAIFGITIAFAYFVFQVEKRFWWKIFLASVLVVSLAAQVVQANPSRGGFLGMVAVGFYCLMRSRRKIMGIFVVLIGVGAVAALAGPAYWAEIATTSDVDSGTADYRIEVWKTGVRMWQANPILGVGAGSFRWVTGEYQSDEQREKFGRDLGGSILAHSLHIELLAEEGSAGVLVYLAMMLVSWRNLGRIIKDVKRRGNVPGGERLNELAAYSEGLRAAILAINVNGVFLSLLYYSHIWLLVAVSAAIPHIYRRELAALNLAPQATAGPAKVRTRGGAVPMPSGRPA